MRPFDRNEKYLPIVFHFQLEDILQIIKELSSCFMQALFVRPEIDIPRKILDRVRFDGLTVFLSARRISELLFDEMICRLQIEIREPLRGIIADRNAVRAVDDGINQVERLRAFDNSPKAVLEHIRVD